MNAVTSKIKIDFLRPAKNVVKLARDDAYTRKFEISLYAGGQAYEPDDNNVLYAVYFTKPDGTTGGYDTMPDNTTAAVTRSGNVLTVKLAPQVTTAPGNVKFGVALYKASGEQLQTFDIDLIVEDSAGDGAVSNDYWNLQSLAGIQTAVTALQTLCVDFTGATTQTAGTRGLVPAPAVADRRKVLKGDGQWGYLNADDIGTQSTHYDAQDVQGALDELATAIGGGSGGGAVSSVNGKTGAVTLDANDIGVNFTLDSHNHDVEEALDDIGDAVTDLRASTPSAPVRKPRVHSINHRGYSTVAPENTLPAFLMSKARGFDMVETDIKFTQDGVAVLLHDDTINRTARSADGTAISGDINIGDITYAQSQEYDFGIWKNAKYAGTKIPTLAQFLKLCKENGLHPYLEMKSSGLTQTNIQTAVNEVKAAGMIGRVTWISFNHTTLEGIAQLDSVDRLGLIVNEEVTQTHISAVKGLDSTGKRGFIDSTNYSAVSIAACQNANIPLEVWGINSATERSVIQALPVYVSGVTSAEAVASEIIRSNKGRRHDSTHLCITRVTQNGLGSDGNAASTSSENQDVLTDFIPVLAGEVYEVRYRVPATKSPVIRYATFDTAFTQLSNDYSSTPYDTVNGYRIRNLQITIAQDGYLRVSCRSYGVASFGLVRVKDADGVLLPSLERMALERAADTDAQAAAMAAQLTAAAQFSYIDKTAAYTAADPASLEAYALTLGEGAYYINDTTFGERIFMRLAVLGQIRILEFRRFHSAGHVYMVEQYLNGTWYVLNHIDTEDGIVKLAGADIATKSSVDTLITQLNAALAQVVGGGSNA